MLFQITKAIDILQWVKGGKNTHFLTWKKGELTVG
jgi:hypothetical protein